MNSRTGRWAARWSPLLSGLLALVLAAPGIGRGLSTDDYIHRSMLVGEERLGGFLAVLRGLFAFSAQGSSEEWIQRGVLPWWTSPDLRISFFRPLSAFTHWLDYAAWGGSPAVMHTVNVLLYAVLCVVFARLVRRFHVGTVAWLAPLLFAVDEGHAFTVLWIANRNALLAGLFAVLALHAHHRWRSEGDRRAALASGAFLLCGLLSAEGAVAVVGFLAAYTAFLDGRRWRALVPSVGLVLAWRVAYSLAGFGAEGTDLYVDPGREPAAFALRAAELLPVLLAGQLFWPDPILYVLETAEAARVHVLAAWLFLLVLAAALAPRLRRDATLRFWVAGTVLATLPFASVGIPGSRVLLIPSLGAAVVLAALFESALRFVRGRLLAAALVGGPALVLFLVHTLGAVVAFQGTIGGFGQYDRRVMDSLALVPEAEGRDVFVLNAPCVFFFVYLPAVREVLPGPVPRSLHVVGPGAAGLELERVDERTLLVRPGCGFAPDPRGSRPRDGALPVHTALLDQALDRSFRGARAPLAAGHRVVHAGFTVEATETSGGQAREARYLFEDPGAAARALWLEWDGGKYRIVQLPAPGERRFIAGPLECP